MSVDIINKGRQLVKFYVDTMMADRIIEAKRQAVSLNPSVDSDLVMAAVESAINNQKECLIDKVNYTCLLLFDMLAEGKLQELAKFDILFADLVERQLLQKKDFDRLLTELQGQVKSHSSQQGKH